MPDLKIIKEFPDNFTFGVATSSYQIEGNSFGNSGLSHWDHFSKIKGNVYKNESGKIACADFLHIDFLFHGLEFFLMGKVLSIKKGFPFTIN